MTATLVIFHGLPGSGKSTLAREFQGSLAGPSIILERDALRTELFGEEYHSGSFPAAQEAEVTEVMSARLREALEAGVVVINSDTNLNPRLLEKTARLALACGATIEQIYVDVPVEVAKERNAARGRAGGRLVPEEVIDRMAKGGYGEDGHLRRFIISATGKVHAVTLTRPGGEAVKAYNAEILEEHPLRGKRVALLDVDSTLANNTHHSRRFLTAPAAAGLKKDFTSFYEGLQEAPVNAKVVALARHLREAEGMNLFVLTGRDDAHAEALISFLRRAGAPVTRVVMKPHGDFRPDHEFKAEALDALAREGFSVVHAVDDRPSVVALLEARGITVSRVLAAHERPYAPGEDGPDEEPAIESAFLKEEDA